jgi:monofunctional biosynthetic peptidoglycan transglycosylase
VIEQQHQVPVETSDDAANAQNFLRKRTEQKLLPPHPISRTKNFLRWLLRIGAAMIIIPIIQVALLRFIDPPITAMMIFRAFDHLVAGESIFWKHTSESRTQVAPSLYKAVIAGEDQRFFQHHGFDMTEIENAQRQHTRHPDRPMRGASTISQQTSKNLFLPPWHNFIRKGIEAYYTVLIEFIWTKMRILEVYGNLAEFAPNVYGAEAGAQFHFKRHAKDLTPMQCALMAAVLPNPTRWSASHPSAYILRRASRILRQMQGLPTDEEDDGSPD